MPALGHKVFELQPSADQYSVDEDELLYFSRNHGKGGQATGKVADDGFWVLKGSYTFPTVADYVPKGVASARERYAGLIDSQGILQRDVSLVVRLMHHLLFAEKTPMVLLNGKIKMELR